MQLLNKNIKGHVEVGHIDLQNTISFFDVAENDADRVMKYLTGVKYKGREVRCNEGDEPSKGGSRERRDAGRGSQRDRQDRGKGSLHDGSKKSRGGRKDDSYDNVSPTSQRGKRKAKRQQDLPFVENGKKDDWRQFFVHNDRSKQPVELKGKEPDFSEEGWARRKPRK